MAVELDRIATHVGAEPRNVRGSVPIDRLASVSAATPGALVFADSDAMLGTALASAASAVIASSCPEEAEKPVLVAANPKLAFARAAECFHPAGTIAGVHPSAVIAGSARIGAGVFIGPHTVVSDGAVIGAGTSIAAGCFVGDRVVIGCDCVLHPNVTVYPGTSTGDRVVVHAGAVLGSDGFGFVRDPATGRYYKFPQQGSLRIGNDVEIGANSTIDRGALDETVIADGVKLDNLVHVAHNVSLGENVVVAALTGISGSCVLERNVLVGGQVGIGDHVHVEEGVILGSGSGVLSHKKVRGNGVVFWGTPARPLKEYLNETAALARLARQNRGARRGEK